MGCEKILLTSHPIMAVNFTGISFITHIDHKFSDLVQEWMLLKFS